MIVQDGEGATKLVEVRVSGARSHRDALTAARAIATSLLVKTALAGEDPNWGRIIAALGASGAQMQEDKVAISYGDEPVVEGGRLRQKVRWERVKEALAGKEVLIQVDVGLGLGQAHIWTSDLTEEYIKINARYTS
jgi:glutamate N-acetyltransferase/amino-acid N-acetyltransferase